MLLSKEIASLPVLKVGKQSCIAGDPILEHEVRGYDAPIVSSGDRILR